MLGEENDLYLLTESRAGGRIQQAVKASMESLSSLKALRAEQARLKAEYDKMEVRSATCSTSVYRMLHGIHQLRDMQTRNQAR